MSNKIPPAGTTVLGRDARAFSKPWYDFLLDLARAINAIPSGGIPPGSITVSQSDVVLGRSSPGAGAVEELTFTDQAQQLADDTTFEEMRNTLGISAENTPYSPGNSGDWGTVPNDVAEALDLLASGGSGVVPTPTLVGTGEDVTIRANTQMLFCIVPTVDGVLTVDGTYCEVN